MSRRHRCEGNGSSMKLLSSRMGASVYLSLCVIFGSWGSVSAADYQHPGGMHTPDQIQRTREKLAQGAQPWTGAWTALIAEANDGLNESPSAPAVLDIPGYYKNKTVHVERTALYKADVDAAYSCAIAWAVGQRMTKLPRLRGKALTKVLTIKGLVQTHVLQRKTPLARCGN